MKTHLFQKSVLVVTAAVLACGFVISPGTARAVVTLNFDTKLVELNLTGGPFRIPLAGDPGNVLGDSIDGFGFVNSDVTINVSSQRTILPGPASLGQATAISVNPLTPMTVIDPDALDGQPFIVDSFFDVFFDITITDVDPGAGRDYAGQLDGATLTLQDIGPAFMQSFATSVLFDKDAPNFGLVPPPEADPFLGHFDIEIPLGIDINQNGEDDEIKFTIARHSVLDANRTFTTLPDPDGPGPLNPTVIDDFDSGAQLEGRVQDVSSDPTFFIGALLPNGRPDPAAFGGRSTSTSRLLQPVIPEPSRAVLLVLGAASMMLIRRRRGC